jgi:hypothetical protein
LALRRRLYHGYIQDEYQATSSLTVSLGLRYEYNGPWFDKYNRLSNFDLDTHPARPRLVLAKFGGIGDRSTLAAHYTNFAPRIGLAQRLGDRTVVRAGYGIYYGGVDHIGDRYLHANRMWSKAIDDLGPAGGQGAPQDPRNLRAERALSDNHVPHRFVLSYNYDLPSGKGGGANRLFRTLLSRWSIGGIATLSSGRPINLSVRGNPSNTGGPDRPDMLRDAKLPKNAPTLDRWFDTEAFRPNAPFTFGSAPRNAVEGPGLVNFDFAACKHFRLAESVSMQFRVEFFNLSNTPPFGGPGSQAGSRNFAVVASAGAPRIIQFAVKMSF